MDQQVGEDFGLHFSSDFGLFFSSLLSNIFAVIYLGVLLIVLGLLALLREVWSCLFCTFLVSLGTLRFSICCYG